MRATKSSPGREQLKDGGGDVVNISSVAGRTARPGNGVYAAAMGG
jgi:NAD(P)-dependent dehydrogenase (short-subunit alcohol dehydrogenase family)